MGATPASQWKAFLWLLAGSVLLCVVVMGAVYYLLPAPAPAASPADTRRDVYAELLRADALAFRKAEREAPIIGVTLEGEALDERFARHFLAFDLERSKLRTAIARRRGLKHNDLRAIDAEGDREGWVKP